MPPTEYTANADLQPIIDRLNRERAEAEADARRVLAMFSLQEIGDALAAFADALHLAQGLISRHGDSYLDRIDFAALEDTAAWARMEGDRLGAGLEPIIRLDADSRGDV